MSLKTKLPEAFNTVGEINRKENSGSENLLMKHWRRVGNIYARTVKSQSKADPGIEKTKSRSWWSF